MADIPAFSGEIRQADPRHLRLVSLRVKGLSWKECAAELGVHRDTVLDWRSKAPIDQWVLEEAFDEVVASRIRMANMHKLADQAIEDSLQATKTIVVNEGKETREIPDFPTRLAASDRVKKPFEKLPQPAEQSPPIPAGGTADGRGSRILDAPADESDEYAELIGPDKHAAR